VGEPEEAGEMGTRGSNGGRWIEGTSGRIAAKRGRVAARRPKQLVLPIRTWGGARKGAGRPAKGARAGVSHARRPVHRREHPVHVTLRVVDGIPNLRRRRPFAVVRAALSKGRERERARLVHFSVQSNHLHLIVEAEDRVSLSRFVHGLSVRIAQGLNRLMSRHGPVLGDRFHARALKTPLQVRRALAYVLGNFRKHVGSARLLVGVLDGCSSARWFDGWTDPDAALHALWLSGCANTGPPVVPPRTWLLRVGFRRHGLIDPDGAPRRPGPSSRR
jgi:REP element-mobilizing transposase RayT